MIAWLKRYTHISLDEIREMEPEELRWYKEGVEDIIKRENFRG